jgi:hypothetical protein
VDAKEVHPSRVSPAPGRAAGPGAPWSSRCAPRPLGASPATRPPHAAVAQSARAQVRGARGTGRWAAAWVREAHVCCRELWSRAVGEVGARAGGGGGGASGPRSGGGGRSETCGSGRALPLATPDSHWDLTQAWRAMGRLSSHEADGERERPPRLREGSPRPRAPLPVLPGGTSRSRWRWRSWTRVRAESLRASDLGGPRRTSSPKRLGGQAASVAV